MEALPLPLGVISPSASTTSGSQADVTLGAAVPGFSNLEQGKLYYCDTMGNLVKGAAYYGREEDAEFAYVVSDADGTLVSAEGKVGFAASQTTLFVRA